MTTLIALSLLAPFVLLLVAIVALRWALPGERKRMSAESPRAQTTSEPAARTEEGPTVERRVVERRVA